jgi:hypothetical protein
MNNYEDFFVVGSFSVGSAEVHDSTMGFGSLFVGVLMERELKIPPRPPLATWGIRNGHVRAGEIPARDRRNDGDEKMDVR